MDPTIDKWTNLHSVWRNNLDDWLCNVYFEVAHLPKHNPGVREFEVELQFRRDLELSEDNEHDVDEDARLESEDVGLLYKKRFFGKEAVGARRPLSVDRSLIALGLTPRVCLWLCRPQHVSDASGKSSSCASTDVRPSVCCRPRTPTWRPQRSGTRSWLTR